MEKRGAKAVFGFDITRHIADVDTSKIHGVDRYLAGDLPEITQFISYELHVARSWRLIATTYFVVAPSSHMDNHTHAHIY